MDYEKLKQKHGRVVRNNEMVSTEIIQIKEDKRRLEKEKNRMEAHLKKVNKQFEVEKQKLESRNKTQEKELAELKLIIVKLINKA